MPLVLALRTGMAVIAAAALWSCGGSSSPTAPTPSTTQPAPAPSAQTVSVAIVGSVGNRAYNPNPVNVRAGDNLVFRNNDGVVHRIMIEGVAADLGDIAPGGTSRSFTVQSTTPMNFRCMNHPSMVGSINGSTAPEPPPCDDPFGYC